MLTPNDDIVRKADSKGLTAAKKDDQRHRLHAEAATSAAAASPYFKQWVKDYLAPTIVNVRKLEQLINQFAWPPVTVAITDKISDAAAAVHTAQDRLIEVNFRDEKLQVDFEQYLERIDLAGFIAHDCHNAMMSAPNSFVVVDLPVEQTTAFPEPFPYLLPTDSVRSAKMLTGPARNGLLDYIFFETDKPGIFALFDTVDYSLWKRDNKTGEGTGRTVKDGSGWSQVAPPVAHNLGTTPVFKLWADVDQSNPFVSNTIQRPNLGKNDRLLFWDAGREQNDLAAGFPMFWHFRKSEEAPQDPRPNDATTYGPTGGLGADIVSLAESKCEPRLKSQSGSSLFGPTSTIPIDAPQSRDDADWRLPAGWIAADVDNLKYIKDKVDALALEIEYAGTGYEATPNGQAVNEQQVMSILERSRRIAEYLAGYFSLLHRRIIDTLGKLRYGDQYLGCTVNYGHRFSLLSGDQLQTLYTAAKTGDMSDWLLEGLDSQLQEYYFRGNAAGRLRAKIITDVNKYCYRSSAELSTLSALIFDPQGYALSVGLLGYIRQFEREQGVPIERFGINIDYSKRVQTIYEALKSYVTVEQPEPAPGSGQSGDKQPESASA